MVHILNKILLLKIALKKPTFRLAPLLLALCEPNFANAQPGSVSSEWDYRLSPYGWFAGSKGEVSSIDGFPPAPFDVTSKDAFDDNEVALTFIFEAKKNQHGVLVDVMYSDTQSNEPLVPEFGLGLNSISKNTIISTSYVYSLIQDDKTVIDAMAGVRYWEVDSTLEFEGGLGFLGGRTIKNSEDWLDPVLGLKAHHKLDVSGLFLQGWFGLGGLGLGSDYFYDTAINLGYQWNRAIATTVGYRQYDVDYDDGFVYDAKNSGWMFGLTWKIN